MRKIVVTVIGTLYATERSTERFASRYERNDGRLRRQGVTASSPPAPERMSRSRDIPVRPVLASSCEDHLHGTVTIPAVGASGAARSSGR